jgi:hypothetical protein
LVVFSMSLLNKLLSTRLGLILRSVRPACEKFADVLSGIGKERLLFMGDSHVEMFQYIKGKKLLNEYAISTMMVPGATAQGMMNPYSKTNALESFKLSMDRRSYRCIFIHLGEVDCGFVIWYRALKYNESVEFQLERSLTNYFEFVRYLLDLGHKDIALTGAVLPTIRENKSAWGEIASLRKEVEATQEERTELTLRYNSRLRDFAGKTGIGYIDITEHILNPETGLIADRFRNENRFDHHLSSEKAAPFWVREIKAYLADNPKA